MRTFSALTQAATCAHPEVLDFEHAPNPRRMEAAATGEEFHLAAAAWIAAHQKGETFFDSGYSPVVRRWLNRLRGAWTPPAGIEVEVPLGLRSTVNDEPAYVEVREVEPHVYVPVDKGVNTPPLLTAGRADLLWPRDMVVEVCDIKTGKDYLGPPDRIVQLLACGYAAALRGGFIGLRLGIYYARAAAFDWSHDMVLATEPWRRVVEAALRDSDPQPSAACLGCWSSPHRRGRCQHSAVEDA